MEEKTCTTCNKSKPLDEFYTSIGGKQGVQSVCVECKKKVSWKVFKKKYKKNWFFGNTQQGLVFSVVIEWEEPSEMEYHGEPLPFTVVDEITANTKYLLNLAGL